MIPGISVHHLDYLDDILVHHLDDLDDLSVQDLDEAPVRRVQQSVLTVL